jgi:N-acetylmuramic acid 6-phosphate etherase
MVDLVPTNTKLVRRAVAVTILATGADEATVRRALEACRYRVKVAIVMLILKLDAAAAETHLVHAHGAVRAAVAKAPPLPL